MNGLFMKSAVQVAILTYSLRFVPSLIHLFAEKQHSQDYSKFDASLERTREIYDFIIVGGGAAGSVLANRLSQNPNYQVLLLEKGGDPNPFTSIPFFYGGTAKSPDTVHIYKSVKQDNSYRLNQGILEIPQGFGLGGSTDVNDMQYLSGSPSVYNEWAKLTGDSEWSFSKVLPFFKKFENYRGRWPTNTSYRSIHGEIHVETQTFHPTISYLHDALKEKGYEEKDLNAGGPADKEFDLTQMNTKKGRRQCAYTALLKSIMKKRKNLTIFRYATVKKILFDSKNRAIGVNYVRHGGNFVAKAGKEVVISAGALESPKLLMLSGVGPKKDLEELEIPCKADLPVGKRYLDHTGVTLVALFNESVSFIPQRDLNVSAVPEYLEHGDGPLRSVEGFFMMIYRKASVDKRPTPALQIIVGSGTVNPATDSYEPTLDNKDRNVILIYNYQPKSVGRLKLASRDYRDDPIINPNFYAHPEDIKIVLDGLRYVLELYETTKSYKKLNATITPETQSPACEKFKFRSDEYWECYIRESTNYGIHPSGACTMGKDSNDPVAVVDSKLRVIGVTGLRVIDSSIIPKIPNVNLMVPTLMIGERGASFVQKHWELREGKNIYESIGL